MLFIIQLTMPVEASSAELKISPKMNNYSLADFISYYEDKSGTKTLEEIQKIDESEFRLLSPQTVNLGYSSSVFWMKINIANSNPYDISWIIESQYPLIDYITFYIPAVFGYNEIQSGDRLPFRTMPYGYFNFISKITSPSGSSVLYIRIKSEGSIITKFRAWDEESFMHNMFNSIAVFWLFYGIMFALLLYNLFIFISTKDETYFALSGFILAHLFFNFTHNGMARKFLWPDLTWWSNYSHPFFVFTSTIFLIWFTKRYLNTKSNLPVTNRILNFFIIIIIPVTLLSFFLPYSYATKLSVLIAAITGSYLILFTMLPMFRVKKRLALYYLMSWFFFSLGAILLSLRSYGIIHESFIAEWSFQISFATGIILLSVGVADKLNTLRRNHLNAVHSLKQSEERYRLFFDTANDAIVFFTDKIPVYANRNMIEMSGYRDEDFYKSSMNDFFPDKADFDLNLYDVISQMTSGNLTHSKFEYILVRADKSHLDVTISVSSIASGTHRGIFMIISDISSMKKATETIKRQYTEIQTQLNKLADLNNELVNAQNKLVSANSEIEKEKEYLAATLTSIGDGVISYDTNGKIFLMNKVAENFTGLSSSEAIGKDIKDVLKPVDEESKELLFETLGTISDRYIFTNLGVPFKLFDYNGDERIIELNSAVIKIHEKPLGIVLAMRDITIKSRIDNELIKMSKLDSIGMLAGGIAHDFNNLLTGISGNISILKKTGNHGHELTDSLKDIEKAVSRATALAKQLLTFAKGGDPVMTPCRIEDILTESVKFIIKDTCIKPNIVIDPEIPPVLADPNQLSQAINNLLINAVQAMPGGGSISIELHKDIQLPPEIPLKKGKYILLKITDTGTGIPKKNLNKIFDPFFTTKKDGTGFGLTSTYSIIKKHKGYIRVNSRENIGTTFEIFIRSTEQKPDIIENERKDTVTASGGSVLIMDDEDYILEVLIKMLKHHGFSVTSAKNGEEAVVHYKKSMEENHPFDFVILDLTVFNGLGGKETVDILRSIDPDVKAIVSSGYSDNPVLANYRDYGFSGILSKPYIIEDVLKAINGLEQVSKLQ